MVAFLRTKGMRIVIYMDDLLIIAQSKWLAEKQAQEVKLHLKQLGFIISSKSMPAASTVAPFLGVLIDTRAMSVALPPEKITKIQQLASALISKLNRIINIRK